MVHITGKQFKVTKGDVIIIEGYWPPTAGDKISLDKVYFVYCLIKIAKLYKFNDFISLFCYYTQILLVGAADFTLIGRPLIERGLVTVHATIIEKTLSHTKTHFKKKRRKQYKRINCKFGTFIF